MLKATSRPNVSQQLRRLIVVTAVVAAVVAAVAGEECKKQS